MDFSVEILLSTILHYWLCALLTVTTTAIATTGAAEEITTIGVSSRGGPGPGCSHRLYTVLYVIIRPTSTECVYMFSE